jgi:hypothetical protein
MPDLKAEITELSTGLGALGYDLGFGLQSPPSQVVNVEPATWERLRDEYERGEHPQLFTTAWQNG